MPCLGLGLYNSGSGRPTQDAVKWALEAGYRHIDTATVYNNEGDVGKALRESPVSRESVFITTKLWNTDHGYEQTIKAFHKSLDALGVSYVDQYLIHWPVEKLRGDSWQALEKLYEDGLALSIGVSNYTVRHLKELFESADIMPAVNQVEFHTFLYQKELLDFCKEHNIQLVAYSPLARGKKLDDQNLVQMAEKYSQTPALIMLRWALQHEVAVIPKSVHRERIIENTGLFEFEIAKDDMNLLDELNEDYRVCWDPGEIP